MKRRRRAGIFLMVLALLILQLPVDFAEAAASADFRTRGRTLVSYSGSDPVVSIPAGIEIIGSSAFENNKTMERVVLSSKIKRIDAYAFWNCSALSDISFGSGILEIGDYSFTGCKSLRKVMIPSNVTAIGIHSFADCTALEEITIPPEVMSIHETAFDGCHKLVIHSQPGSYADQYAEKFYRRQRENKVEYEDVILDDAAEAEEGGNENIPEPENTHKPENMPSSDDGDAGEKDDDRDGSKDLGSTHVVGNQAVLLIDRTRPSVYQGILGITSPEISGQQTLEGLGNAEVQKYRIVDGTVIADQAFYRDENLDRIVTGEGIREIGELAFARCTAKSLYLPEGVDTICYGAFYHCDLLTEVTLPMSMMHVAPKAFEHTPWVEAFRRDGTGGQGDFLISGGVLVAYRGNAEQLKIPEGVRVIAGECFLDNQTLVSVAFPESLQYLEEAAFEGCGNLRKVIWNENLRHIGDRAFARTALEAADLPESLETVGRKAFEEECVLRYKGMCPTETYSSSAQRLSNEAFRVVEGEEDLFLPKGVTTVGTPGAEAELSNVDRAYKLEIVQSRETEDVARAQKALKRNLLTYGLDTGDTVEAPSDNGDAGDGTTKPPICYRLQLLDSALIPIRKLGKEILQICLPIPKEAEGRRLRAFLYDRNGQLEELEVTYHHKEAEEMVCLKARAAYDLILLPCSEELTADDFLPASSAALEEQEFRQEAAGPGQAEHAGFSDFAQNHNKFPLLRNAVGGCVLLAGLALLLVRTEKRRK